MKTKLISLTLLLIITATLILMGCGNDSQPNFGATGPKIYEPTLSAMSDDAIRIKIDELYDKMPKYPDFSAAPEGYALATILLQNELILRQLEALNDEPETLKWTIENNSTDNLDITIIGLKSFTAVDSDKWVLELRHHHVKLGIKGLGQKHGLKGFGKSAFKGN